MGLRSCGLLLSLAASATLLVASGAHAQADIVGSWNSLLHEDTNERFEGPEIGEYEGLPINPSARAHGEAWSSSLWTVPEHQCIPHPADYAPNFTGARIWQDVDPATQKVVAYHTLIAWMNPVRTIWMDGRPHPPPDALHTWEGFSTGVWDGDVLTVTTTHLKPAYLRRNGIPRSDKATLVEHFIRTGDVLTWVSVINDPVYLTEPMIRSRDFQLDPGFHIGAYPCSVEIEVPRPEGEIPHVLPGKNADLFEYAKKHNLPRAAVMGGAQTEYPEFQQQIRGGFEPAPRGGR